MKKIILNIYKRLKPIFETIVLLSGILGICYTLFCLIIKPVFFPSISIECLPRIDSYEGYVWANYYPQKSNYSVEIFVKPNDGQEKYYLQYKNNIINNNGLFINKIRFGNPNCIDMMKCPPLEFYIYAVLLKNKDISMLPTFSPDSMWVYAKNETEFYKKLKAAKYLAISKNSLIRLPETFCYDSKPVFTSPKVDYTIKPLMTKVSSEFKLSWEPSIKMYIEIRDQGTIIKKGYVENDTILNLGSGLYEITIMQRPGYECFEKLWINVLSN